mmetsp:Transcript_24383/g.29553  ORF Transcript_24383/g.29553 Transcript_24383/m.29553 type:complete len:241 (+) Transcript_24383:78-800(+)
MCMPCNPFSASELLVHNVALQYMCVFGNKVPNTRIYASEASSLFVIFLVVSLATRSLGLALHAARAATTEGTLEGEVDVLLALQTDQEAGHVDNLLADANVSLLDEHTGVVDGLSQTQLEDLGLQTALQEVGSGQCQHVIQLILGLIQKTVTGHAAHDSITLEQTLVVLLIKGKQDTGSLTDLGKSELHTEKLTLVAQTILSDQLQLNVETLLLERTTGPLEGLTIVAVIGGGRHLDTVV